VGQSLGCWEGREGERRGRKQLSGWGMSLFGVVVVVIMPMAHAQGVLFVFVEGELYSHCSMYLRTVGAYCLQPQRKVRQTFQQ
jgi:hypothetical protein